MIQFKEINGQLCKMLEKPVPLTPDAQFPCLVRLIQDDSPMGRYNKWNHDYIISNAKSTAICHRFFASEKVACFDNYDGVYYAALEIIGLPVAEGSKEWALYQMQQGKFVCHQKALSISYYKPTHYVKRKVRDNCTDDMSIEVWLNGADPTGWQLYEPKEEPPFANVKVGDWVEIKVDGNPQCQKKVSEVSPCFFATGKLHFDMHGNGKDTISLPYIATRILFPSEVVVSIGCLSGTVSYALSDDCFLLIPVGYDGLANVSLISMAMLDAPTRSLIEGLLKQMEEQCKS